MRKHDLTPEQLTKFFDAVGARPPEISGSQFTAQELLELAELNEGFTDWPKHTDDPKVNYVIDCITEFMCGDEESEYDEALYLREIEAFKTLD